MDLGLIVIVGLAVVVGLATALGLKGWLRRRSDRDAASGPITQVGLPSPELPTPPTPPTPPAPRRAPEPPRPPPPSPPPSPPQPQQQTMPAPLPKAGPPAPPRPPLPPLGDPLVLRPLPEVPKPPPAFARPPAAPATDLDPFSAPTADLYLGHSLDLDLSGSDGPGAAGAEPPAPTPVLMGVTAPESCAPGTRFNAILAAYIEAARATAEAQLKRMGGPLGVPLLDVPPDSMAGWVPGAPVTVRLSAPGATVEPAERQFSWNGRLNLAPFVVQVAPGASGTLELCFQVALAGVPIAHIPLPVTLTAAHDALLIDNEPLALLRQKDQRSPSSAFASYASKDAQLVGYCLSALSRWSPGLTIFQDCLDLQPGDAFKPQLQQRIHDSDCFLLFWSRNASASKWVRWELDTARADKGLAAVIPMPLEDPAIAAPPPEFADVHLRDRFMMARYGLARIRDEAALPPPTA